MTVSSDTNRADYTGNGSTVNFATAFRFLQNSDVKVILTVTATGVETEQTEITDYTLVGAGLDAGGTVTMIVAPPTGTTLTIKRDVPLTQQTDYVENDNFPAESHEDALDKLTMINQQQQEELDRSLKIAESQTSTGLTVPAPSTGLFLQWDASGNLVNVDILLQGALAVSDFAKTYLDDLTAAATRATMGHGSASVEDVGTDTGDVVQLQDVSGSPGLPAVDGSLLTGINVSDTQIQSVTAAVAASALTLGLKADTLEFRSATLTDGIVGAPVSFSDLSLVIPDGATGGTVDAIQSDLILVALNNAGTAELAFVNLSGGNDLTETGVITTVAIDATADLDNVFYSTTARTGVAYRVVGRITSTQATAGTWATSPTVIQGMGGNALTAMDSLGYGQTPQDVTGSRTLGVTEHNDTGKPINVAVSSGNTANSGNAYWKAVIDGVDWAFSSGSSGASGNITIEFTVPAGSSYSVANQNGTATVTIWSELR